MVNTWGVPAVIAVRAKGGVHRYGSSGAAQCDRVT